jgi:hypothetical protein
LDSISLKVFRAGNIAPNARQTFPLIYLGISACLPLISSSKLRIKFLLYSGWKPPVLDAYAISS